jgi:hypothetical protein
MRFRQAAASAAKLTADPACCGGKFCLAVSGQFLAKTHLRYLDVCKVL